MSTLQEAIAAKLAAGGSTALHPHQMDGVIDAVTEWLQAGPGGMGDAPQIWDSTIPPGGWVCSVCGTPVESEPCADHMPNQTAEMNAEMDDDPTPLAAYECQGQQWYHDGSRELHASFNGGPIPKCPECGR